MSDFEPSSEPVTIPATGQRLFSEDDEIVKELTRQFNEGELTPEFDTTPTVPEEEEQGESEVEEPQTEISSGVNGDVDENEGEEETPTSSSPSEIDLNSLSERYFGRRLNEQEASGLLAIQRDIQSIAQNDPDRFYQIQALLNGQTLPSPQQQVQQPAPQPAPQQAPTPQTSTPEYVDPEIAAALTPVVNQTQQLQQQFAALQAQQQQIEAYRLQEEQTRRATLVNTAQDEWRNSKQTMSPEEYIAFDARVVNKVRSTGGELLNSYIRANGNDIAAGTKALLEAEYYADPTFREREIHALVQKEMADQAEQRKKTNKSTALSGSGGGGARPTGDQSAVPKDPAKRHDAMIAELTEIMNQ